MPKSSFTTKDLTFLQEVMGIEMLMHKKCASYASQASDQSLREVMEHHSATHKKRFDALYNYLSTIDKS